MYLSVCVLNIFIVWERRKDIYMNCFGKHDKSKLSKIRCTHYVFRKASKISESVCVCLCSGPKIAPPRFCKPLPLLYGYEQTTRLKKLPEVNPLYIQTIVDYSSRVLGIKLQIREQFSNPIPHFEKKGKRPRIIKNLFKTMTFRTVSLFHMF